MRIHPRLAALLAGGLALTATAAAPAVRTSPATPERPAPPAHAATTAAYPPAGSPDGWPDDLEAPPASSVAPCPNWPMYGRTPVRTFATDCPSPIDRASVARLVPDWFLKTAGNVTASPTVMDGTIYVGDWSGTMYAIDAATGDVRWTHQTPPAPSNAFGPIVSSAAVADVPVDGVTRRLVVFGSGPRVFALDARDGSTVWVHALGTGAADDPTEVESSPVIWDGVVYVGKDVHDHVSTDGAPPRGGLVALDAATGAQRWFFDPQQGGTAGCDSVWSSPTLDVWRHQVYVATGNCPADVAWSPYVEAVTALDMDTGEPRWSFQPHPPNRNDTDFGATPNLFTLADGTPVLGAGNKDATYYAIDPSDGHLRWSTQVAAPGNVQKDFAIGGFIGSPAALNGDVFGTTALGGPGYMHGLDGATGAQRWQGAAGPSYGASAAVNGLVFAASLDGNLRAFDTRNGLVRWAAPLGAPASSGPTIVGDQVFVGSGTSSSDACAKDTPVVSPACQAVLGSALGKTGGLHAFVLARPGSLLPTGGGGTGFGR